MPGYRGFTHGIGRSLPAQRQKLLVCRRTLCGDPPLVHSPVLVKQPWSRSSISSTALNNSDTFATIVILLDNYFF